jgi:hypothetical protein
MTIIASQAKSVSASMLESELTDMDAGILKDVPAKSPLTINGTAMTPAQIDTQVQSYLATIKAVNTAKAQYETALVARRNIQVEARNFYLQLKKAVIVYFGVQSAQLVDFGLTPAKTKTAQTTAQKAVSVAKLQMTRAARGTTSKKQKQQINPTVANPAVAIGPDGKLQAIPGTAIAGAVPGSTASTTAGSSSTASTTAGSNGSAPATGATGSTAAAGS